MRERTCAERIIMKSSVAKHYGCMHAGHCGLTTNGRSQANQDFFCVRNMNWCFARRATNLTRKQHSKEITYSANRACSLL